MKLGRNDPCHCGSGKKYKKCHQSIDEDAARNVRSLRTPSDWFGHHVKHLNSVDLSHIGDNPLVQAAWTRWAGDSYSDTAFNDILFRQYILFDLAIENDERLISRITLEDHTNTADDLKNLRDALTSSHFTALEVIACRRGKQLVLLDRLVGEEIEINDPALTETLEPMEIVIGRVARWQDHAFLVPGWEKMYFRGRKAAIKNMVGVMSEHELDDDDVELKQTWVKREAIAVVQGLRAARPNQY